MDRRRAAKRRIPRSAWLRLAAWAALLALGFAVVRFTPLGELLTEERLVALATEVRGAWWAPLALIVLYTVLAPLGLPLAPLIVSGAVFGAFYGTIYNTTGLFLGAAASYLLARFLGRDFVIRVAGPRLRRVGRLFDRHGFWPLVQTRFLPLPSPLVNFGAALAGVRLPLFLAASAVGLFPSALIHTWFIAEIFTTRGSERALTGAAYVAVFVVFNAVLAIPSLRERTRRRQRYRELVARRAARRGAPPSGE